MQRRDFVRLGSTLAAMAAPVGIRAGEKYHQTFAPATSAVDFVHDGLGLSAQEYAELLMRLADEGKIKTDYYSNGGVVEECENKFARLLGKESAVFFPTGTLANHIAVRRLAPGKNRVMVQEQSHLYNDCGDCAQTLSGLNLIPLGNDTVSFSLQEAVSVIEKNKKGRVETQVGVMSLETPVRRQYDKMIPVQDVKVLTDFAKKNGIKTHLDGARLFIQTFHTQTDAVSYGSLFDTVYTSLWKCFNAASGAVLAGSKSFTEKLFHERRMFGGSLPGAWPFAAIALHYADSFSADYARAWNYAEKIFSEIQKDNRVRVEKFENGSHIVRLHLQQINSSRLRESLLKKGIELPAADAGGFYLKINPSLLRQPPEEIAKKFMTAIQEQV